MPRIDEVIDKIARFITANHITTGKEVLELLKKGKSNAAFLHACQQCKPQDQDTLRLIKLLISHHDDLKINVNATKDGFSALLFATVNENLDLYIDLLSAGAEDKTATTLMSSNFTSASKSIQKLYHEKFLTRYNILLNDFADKRSLPDRETYPNDEENAQFDLTRVIYILNVIQFLMEFQKPETRLQGGLPKNPSPLQLATISNEQMTKNRLLLEKLCLTIQNLSSTLRIKYSKFFSPAPFTWITFDQLGGIIIEPAESKVTTIPVLDFDDLIESEDREQKLRLVSSSRQFLNEIGDLQPIIEEAVTDIIEKDLPALKAFFHKIAMSLMKSDQNIDVPPITLAASKCLVGYSNDVHNLIKLINLASFSEHIKMSKTSALPSSVLLEGKIKRPHRFEKRFDLSSKMGRHAALRLLQSLGELITGKNFSKFLIDLDPTVDWRTFIVIRDAITHQDEKDYHYKIEQFLQNEEALKQIFGDEFAYFWQRLINLLVLREQKLGAYQFDPKTYWANLFNLECSVKEPAPEEQKASSTVERRVNDQEENEFLDALKTYKAPESVFEQCKGIFSGAFRANKQQIGSILQCFPKKSMGEYYKHLSEILTKATSKPATSESERQRKREEEQLASQRREQERRAKFKGLDSLRAFADRLEVAPQAQHMLNPSKRLDLAIEALENIREFLIDVAYLNPSLAFTTVQDWDNHSKKLHRPALYKLLDDFHELNYAIEYNAGQLLQHLETLRGYKHFKACEFINNNYPALRAFRNYLEHGDPLFDNNNEVWTQSGYRQQQTAPMIIRLVFELLPQLQEIKQRILFTKTAIQEISNPKDEHPGPFVSDKEFQEWTKLSSKSYSPHGFFSLDGGQKDQSIFEAEKEFSYY
nr:hypothetical protein [Legionella jordanis]